ELQIGDVGANDHQHEADDAKKKHVEAIDEITRNPLTNRHHVGIATSIRDQVIGGNTARQRFDLNTSLIERDIKSKPIADNPVESIAHIPFRKHGCERNPEFDRYRKSHIV